MRNIKTNRKGTLIIDDIKFDDSWRRKVMRSGEVAKIYLPKTLIDKDVFVILPRRKK